MNFKKALFFVAITLFISACDTKSYQIKGIATEEMEGDTLFLTYDITNTDNITNIDTLVITDKKFKTRGFIDAPRACILYSNDDYDGIYMPFIVEQGTIKINLEENRIGGTQNNDRLQQYYENTEDIKQEMSNLFDYCLMNDIDDTEQEELEAQFMELKEQFCETTLDYIEDNIDNECGFYLLAFLEEVIIDPFSTDFLNVERMLNLIEKMPENMRQREAIVSMISRIEDIKKSAIGCKIEDFTMQNPEGDTIDLMEQVRANAVTIIDFWASWCGPCVEEMPNLIKIYNQWKSKGLGIVGVSLDKDSEDWVTAIKKLGIIWPQMSDLQGWNNEISRKYNVRVIPYTIVVDSIGTILCKGLRGEELDSFIVEMLNDGV